MYSNDALSIELQSQFERWQKARKPQELRFLDFYQDVMRISRDDDTKDTGAAKAQKSKVFIGSTRGKVRSAKAKIKDALFAASKYPFDTSPTNEQLKDYADAMESILKLQLDEMDFRGMLGMGVDSICQTGTGFIFGPFVETKEHKAVSSGVSGLKETKHEYKSPRYEHARTIDVYADPDAETEQDGMGIYWSARKQPHEIKALKDKGYNDDAIDYALTQATSEATEGSDLERNLRADRLRYEEDGRIWFQRYFGLVKKSELKAWKSGEDVADIDDDDLIEAVVIMAGGVVIKAEESPWKKRPARRCVYEEVAHEFYGVGIAENNEPHQRVTNAAFRLYMEGKAFALLKTCSIDQSKFLPTEDFKLFPGKKYHMRPGMTPDERKTAIIWHDVQDVTQGWESVITLSEKFSDDDTGITKYTQGNDATHLNKTATGISMIMNASSLPMKEVLQNIDRMWVEEIIEGLIEWDIEFLEADTVKVLLGEEIAKKWSEIKQFGKTSFMEWQSTGSSTFMAKEVLMNKLQGFMQVALSNPLTAQEIDVRELLTQVWEAGEIGKESPILDDKARQEKQNNPMMQQAQQQMQEMQQQAQQVIQKMQEGLKQAAEENKQLQQRLSDKSADNQYKQEQLRSSERLELARLANQSRDSRASADLKEAQTVKTNIEAGLIPEQHALEVAQALLTEEYNGIDRAASADTAAIELDAELAADQAGTGADAGTDDTLPDS